MTAGGGLVSIGLPVRNGANRVERVIATVLAQTHDDLELVISDNASEDRTEEVCRDLVRTDPRIRYYRQPHDIGQLGNFTAVLRLARGGLFKWVGDDDALEPGYLSECVTRITADPRLMLVTTQQTYTESGGEPRTEAYHRTELGSDDPVERLREMLRLQTESHLLLDPVYGLMRRDAALAVPHRVMLQQDQLFATRMTLAGPWAHVPEILAHRGWNRESRRHIAQRFELPAWRARLSVAMQLRELQRDLREAELTPAQRVRATAVTAGWYVRWHRRTALRRAWRAAALLGAGVERRAGLG